MRLEKTHCEAVILGPRPRHRGEGPLAVPLPVQMPFWQMVRTRITNAKSLPAGKAKPRWRRVVSLSVKYGYTPGWPDASRRNKINSATGRQMRQHQRRST